VKEFTIRLLDYSTIDCPTRYTTLQMSRSGRILFLTAFGWAVFAMPAFATATRPIPVRPEHARTSAVTVWDDRFASKRSFETFEKTYLAGAFLAAGDVDGDGAEELIVGSGQGHAPEVRVYATDGNVKSHFAPYPAWFTGGVRVAAGDLDRDGKAEIVTAPGPGIAPEVGVYDASGNRKLAPAGAYAYAKEFIGGVRVAVADFDRDGTVDIATAAGPGGGPHVRFFDGSMKEEPRLEFFAYDASMRDGVTIAAVRTPWGDQLVTGVESWSEPLVRRYSFDANGARLDKEFYAFEESSRAGIVVGAYDLDHDGTDEIVTAGNGGTIPEVRFFDLWGTLYQKALLQDPAYRGALSFAELDADRDGASELTTVAVLPTTIGPTDIEKQIRVDLTDQRLYAYEHGRIAKTYFVSTGVVRHPTPEMKTNIRAKIAVKRYTWVYGSNNPDNYDLPNVKWNLQIADHIFIHSAYWHHNFGYRMSHGCINESIADAKWLYDWAGVGTTVQVAYSFPPSSVEIASR
jgi:hypothetical protein